MLSLIPTHYLSSQHLIYFLFFLSHYLYVRDFALTKYNQLMHIVYIILFAQNGIWLLSGISGMMTLSDHDEKLISTYRP